MVVVGLRVCFLCFGLVFGFGGCFCFCLGIRKYLKVSEGIRKYLKVSESISLYFFVPFCIASFNIC